MLNFNFLQFGEILGILPNTVVEAARSFESKIHCLVLPAIEIPRWFKFNHHLSVGDSVSFLVGPKFSNLVVCIAFPSKDENSNMENHCFIDISINGVKQPFIDFVNYDHVWLIYGKVNISNPSEENHIKVEVRQMVQMRLKNTMRIYVECICCPASSMDQWGFNNGVSTMGKKIQAMLESDTDCKKEIIDQPMLDIPKNTTSLALDGFESDSNSGNEAPNPGDGDFLIGFMTRVNLQSPMPFSMMIPTPICMHHHRRQKHLDSALKRWFASLNFSKFKGLFIGLLLKYILCFK